MRSTDAVAKPPQIDGPEDLARLGESPEQVLEVLAAEHPRDATNRLGLGGAGRADHEHVFARHGRERDELEEHFAIDEAAPGIADRTSEIITHVRLHR